MYTFKTNVIITVETIPFFISSLRKILIINDDAKNTFHNANESILLHVQINDEHLEKKKPPSKKENEYLSPIDSRKNVY